MNKTIADLLSGGTLTQRDTTLLFDHILSNKLEPVVTAAILMAFKFHRETSAEISGAATSLVSFAKPLAIETPLFADCCGTGGDGKGLLNISTAVAFVAVSCGLPVVKHGNRSVSSMSGSADVLEHIGIDLETNPMKLIKQFKQHGLTFAFAPYFHPALKHIMPIRKSLATRTIFNLLGPLVNPARPPVQLMGVYDETLCQPIAETLNTMGVRNGMVVHGSGLDEIAIHDKTTAVMIQNNSLTSLTLTPSDFGVPIYPLKELVGADPKYNAGQLLDLLKGKGAKAYEDAVSVNTAALLFSAGLCDDFKKGVELAKHALADGKPFKLLDAMTSTYTTSTGLG